MAPPDGAPPTPATGVTPATAAAATTPVGLVTLVLPELDRNTAAGWDRYQFRVETMLTSCVRTSSGTLNKALEQYVKDLLDRTKAAVVVPPEISGVDRQFYAALVQTALNAESFAPTLFAKLRQLPDREGWRAFRVYAKHFAAEMTKQAVAANDALFSL